MTLAQQTYRNCTASIDGEAPSALDHNNLADTYRQFGALEKSYYAKAHDEIDQAMQLTGSREDPTFLNTEALI